MEYLHKHRSVYNKEQVKVWKEDSEVLKNNIEAQTSGKWPILEELEQAKLQIKTISDESHARGVKDGRASVFRDTEQQTQLLKQMIDLKDQKIESMAK